MENNKKVYKYGLEDTDKKIKIVFYEDLEFDFSFNELKNEEEYKNMNYNDLEKEITRILGKDSIERFNKKREELGLNKMTTDVALNVMACLFDAYANATLDNVSDSVNKTINNINKKVNDLNNQGNREQRRYNKKNKNNFRGNRRRY